MLLEIISTILAILSSIAILVYIIMLGVVEKLEREIEKLKEET